MNEKKIELINKLKSEINNIDSAITASVSIKNRKNWTEHKEQIERSIKQFDSNKHFIIATGMLKAGKSTLINLLARTPKASLVGFGIDTTLRPALIKMSDDDKGCIKVYYPKDGYDRKDAFQSLVDELRGLAPKFTNKPSIFNLDDEHLKKTLCRTVSESDDCLTKEPIIVIVEVPKNENSLFFKNNCILLDMPGLDSGFSEQSKNGEEYKAFFNECDLLLFVQSSVAPINEKAGEYLKYIGLTRNESTYRLVQNVMNAKYWLKNSVTEKEQQRQAKNGKEVFADKLNKRNTVINPVHVNLGMAYDSLFTNSDDIEIAENESIEAKKEKLLKESNYAKLEQGFIDDIQNNGEHRHYIHCHDNLKNEIEKTGNAIENQLEKIEASLKQNKIEKENQENIIASIKRKYEKCIFPNIQFTLSANFERKFKEELFKVFDSIKNSAEYAEKFDKVAEDKNFTKFRCKASVLTKFMKDCAEKGMVAAKDFFENSNLDNLVHIEDDKSKSAIELAQSELMKLSEDLKEIGININGNKISADTNTIGNLNETSALKLVDTGSYQKKRALGFLWEVKINDFDREQEYSKIVSDYIFQIRKLINENYNASCRLTELMRDVITDDINSEIEKTEKKRDNLASEIEELNKDCKTLKDSLDKIQKLAKDLPNANEFFNNKTLPK